MIALISCGKAKLDHAAPAREMYTGNLFRAALADCESRGLRVFILSAKHGLVGPDDVLEPYDLKLTDLPLKARLDWAQMIGRRLSEILQWAIPAMEIHAGAVYASYVAHSLEQLGDVPSITNPCQGMQIGERLHYYKERRSR